MAIIATGSKTIIDLSDGKSLSVYLGSNQPRTQILDVNTSTFAPDWTTTAGKLVITPVVYANQTAIALTDTALGITWKRREGSSAETALAAGESISGNVLTVGTNKLSAINSGLLTYIAYVTYNDPDTGLAINATADITFALVRTGENARSAWISGEQVFKYSAEGAVSPSQITLSANLQNVTMGRWQYRDADGNWADYPTTSDNASITGTTLIVKPTHAVFVNETATLRVTTSDAGVGDTTSIYKVSDGASGEPGSAGVAAVMAFLTNENITFAANGTGQVAATEVTCNVVAYKGTTKVTPTVGAVSGTVNGMTVTKGSVSDNEIPITIAITSGATLGGSGVQQGTLSVPVTSPVSTTLAITWSKVNTGADGAAGENGVVFSIVAPQGTVFRNGAGTLTLEAHGYDGASAIQSDAGYIWSKYTSGTWNSIPGETGRTLTVAGSSVEGMASYRCQMTYRDNVYTDCITLIDKTDNYQATIISSGGDIFKNSVGTSTLVCQLYQNGALVDEDGTGHTYTWYRLDKDGEVIDDGKPFAQGKSINIDGDDVDGKTTFLCEVS